MRRSALAVAALLAICSSCAPAADPLVPVAPNEPPVSAADLAPQGPVAEAPPTWLGAAPAQTVIVPGGAPTWVGIWVTAPEAAPREARPPMSLGLVVDTSGSMAGAKIENARLAATSLLEGVTTGDVVSIDAFANVVVSIAPPTPVGRGTLGPLFEAVRRLTAAGGTNLYGGLQAGTMHAAASRAHPLRRVIVISDGLANVGPSTPDAIGTLAAQGTELGVQVSAIGVGLDYDERTLGELARRSSGRLYHLEDPSQLAAIMDQEVRLLSSTVATGAYLEISAAPGVQLDGADSAAVRTESGALRIRLGSLYAGQRREVLVRARVRGEPASDKALANVRLVYEDRSAGARWAAQSVAVRAQLGTNAQLAEASADARVSAMITRHEAAEAQRQAAAQLDAGQHAVAAGTLSTAEAKVVAAAKRADDPAERARLTAQAARMAQSRNDFLKKGSGSPHRARALSLQTYQYSFSDDGLAAPVQAPPVQAPPPQKAARPPQAPVPAPAPAKP